MVNEIISAVVGGILAYGGTRFADRLQKMKCFLLSDEVLSKISTPIGGVIYDNVYSKEFQLVNTTSKDFDSFSIIFTFDQSSSVIDFRSQSKEGLNWQKMYRDKKFPNKVIAKVKSFNRGDKISFFIRVGNVTENISLITESACTGFKIKLDYRRDRRH